MAIHHELQNIDRFYNDVPNKIIINELERTEENRNRVMRYVYQKYDISTDISVVATCECGHLNDNFREGDTCPLCGTVAESPKSDFLPRVWMRGYGEKLFINPKIWLMVNKLLGRNIDTLLYLSDLTYKPRGKILGFIQKLVDSGEWNRSYETLTHRFIWLLEYIAGNVKKGAARHILKICNLNQDELYSKYLPILSKNLFIQEKVSSKSVYTDLKVGNNISLIMKYWKATEYKSSYEQDRVMAQTISALSLMVHAYYSEGLASKTGGVRSKIHATRVAFSGRGVATSITRPHRIDEVEVPWRMGIVIFRPLLINLMLFRFGIPLSKINKKLNMAYNRYDSLIDECFKILIDEAENKALPVQIQRNPTLNQKSDVVLKCTTIKTNYSDNSIGISDLLINAWLAGDYDGDEINISYFIDNHMARAFNVLRPATSIFSQSQPGEIGEHVTLTKGTRITLARMIQMSELCNKQKNTIFVDETKRIKNE